MKTNKVTNTAPISKTEALIQARHIVGKAANTISIDGERTDTSIKQKNEQKVASEAVTLLRHSEMKVVTQNKPASTNRSSSMNKSSSDPLDTLSRVEVENNSDNGTGDTLEEEHKKSLQTASYYILTSTFKSMSSKFVNLFRGETKKNYQKTDIYKLESFTSVDRSQGSTGA